MSDQVKKATEKAERIFAATEEALEKDWDRKENLQFPNLLTAVVSRLSADSKLASEIDPYMRSFVREHPAYYVSRGAKGGIMLRSVHESRLAKKAEVEAAKAVIKAQVDAKVAATAVAPVVVGVVTLVDDADVEDITNE